MSPSFLLMEFELVVCKKLLLVPISTVDFDAFSVVDGCVIELVL